MKRLLNAFGLFWMAITKPKIFKIEWFKLVESMMKFLEQTTNSNHPMKSELQIPKYHINKLGEIHWEKNKYTTVLHLWCGVDNCDSPFKRITDLIEENEKLKRKISDLIEADKQIK